MKSNAVEAKAKRSPFIEMLGLIGGIYVGFAVGGGLGVVLGLMTRGVDALGMPLWAWLCPAVCSAGLMWFYALARRAGVDLGQQSSPRLLKGAALYFLSVCMIAGLNSIGAFGSKADSQIAGLAMRDLIEMIAWITLVVLPSIAFVSAGLILLSTKSGGPGTPTPDRSEWLEKPEQRLQIDESFEQRFARERALRKSQAAGTGVG